MADVTTVVVESSPQEINLSSLSPEERQTWRDTGNLPEPPKADSKPKTEDSAASDTSKETTSAAEHAETAPESETGTTQEQKPRRKGGAEDRIHELLSENKKLRGELETRRQATTTPTAESSTAKPAEQPKAPQAPVKPKLDDFKTYDDYEKANDKYVDDLTTFKAEQAIAKDSQRRAAEAQQAELNGKLAEARTRYADADQVIFPTASTLGNDPQIPAAVKQMINDSPVLVDLLYVLGGKPEDLADFQQSARTNPGAAIRKLVLLEKLVMDELATKPAAKVEEKVVKAPEKPVTNAPRPPSEVGGRGTNTEDEGVAAARAGDIRTAKAAWDRQALARAK